MDKIEKLENPPAERENSLNTEAAARFLKSDLVGIDPIPPSLESQTDNMTG